MLGIKKAKRVAREATKAVKSAIGMGNDDTAGGQVNPSNPAPNGQNTANAAFNTHPDADNQAPPRVETPQAHANRIGTDVAHPTTLNAPTPV